VRGGRDGGVDEAAGRAAGNQSQDGGDAARAVRGGVMRRHDAGYGGVICGGRGWQVLPYLVRQGERGVGYHQVGQWNTSKSKDNQKAAAAGAAAEPKAAAVKAEHRGRSLLCCWGHVGVCIRM
jgi:hypothetical protein